ncbi:membrane transporter [Pyrenophora tritici-repentis Pt-1C-BFP]|uniref:Membrane transporter n=1 Tax=Pyrenophora tritici-repentis (strain Pt-1C-BFP) TaxID=426418 RepID=B2WKH4_PYRTR|nr:membrane transporter [Pyrenophora tritici-repentis Pt-1C-BFP]EDU43534.1 membrane transporter [Pyrenophora tritici-repentis Pt-1C-BFP]
MESADLERSYSREQQGLGPGLEAIATPVALVRSFTSKSHRTGIESSRAARLRELEKGIHDSFETEKEDTVEQVASRTPSVLSTTRGTDPSSETSSVHRGDEVRRRVIRFEDGDPENPNNWSRWKKIYSLIVAIMSVMNSTMNSSLAAGAVGPISRHFNEYNKYMLILPTSMYLVGYACGPMLWGPLSESYGRKGTMVISFAILTVFSIASAVAPNFAALVIFRLLVGVGGSCAVSVVGGICADIYHNPKYRGRSMAIFMAATTFGPILGPPVSGFIGVVSWSWAFWIGAIFAGATWPLFYFFNETYGPTILKRRIYHFNAGETGLTFLPIGVGAVISAGIYLSWDWYLARAQRLKRPWSQDEEMRRLPLACIAGPFFVISAFWLGWTAREGIHWIVPTLAGILFGMGYLCLFMALLNYLVDAYEIFAASAMAAASLSRSSFGAVLPFATKPMYNAMGVAWATSLLGFFSLALCVVPFVFVKWGGSMRDRSKFCQYLRQKKREEEEAREEERRGLRETEVKAQPNEFKGKEDV